MRGMRADGNGEDVVAEVDVGDVVVGVVGVVGVVVGFVGAERGKKIFD